MSDVTPQAERQPEPPVETPPAPRRMARVVGFGLIILSVVLAWLLLVGFLGYQSGQRRLNENLQAELHSQIERQLVLAAENIEQQNNELALVRLAWVMERDPDNQQAHQLQAAAQSALNRQVTPTSVPVQAQPTAVPTTEPSPTPGAIESPSEELQRLRRLSVRKAWPELVPALITFQLQFPNYERLETDQLLYDAYLGYSQQLLEGDQIERGLYYLERAAKLGNLPQTMIDYQTWAELYTQGISFYGANWDAAAYYFRDLCLAAPFYQDACAKLHTALVANGDQFALVEEWCPALLLYEEAWTVANDAELGEKLETARTGCLSATPTPTGPITGTVPITGTDRQPGAPFVIPTQTP